MFTFVIISYNQEEYIIEHLESIKYQIENFGEGIEVNLIMSDDHSTDQTVPYAKKWLDSHQHLFKTVNLSVNKVNQGIVENYLRATKGVKTPKYKILGGDDLYHQTNIFETMALLEENEIIFTPSLTFNEEGVDIYWDLNNLINLKDKESVVKYLKHGYPFNTVGTFYKTSLIQNEGLRQYISQYTWIEDLPSIHYVFNKKRDIRFTAHYKPYVIYRNKAGISNNEDNARNHVFAIEEEIIKKEIGMAEIQKGLNLAYLKVAFIYKYFSFKSNFIPKNREIKEKVYDEIQAAKKHLTLINRRSQDFYSEVLQVGE